MGSIIISSHSDMHEERWQDSEIESAPFLHPNLQVAGLSINVEEPLQQTALGRMGFRIRRDFLHYAISLQSVLLLCIAAYFAYIWVWQGPTNQLVLKGPPVDYEIRTFSWGFGEDTPIYQQKDSDVVNNAWKSLYSGQSTHPPAVLYSLECLDTIRQDLQTDMYYLNETEGRGTTNTNNTRLTHCVEILRQSLMCMADISVIVWQWVPDANEATIRMDVAHTCRKFEQVQTYTSSG